MMSSKKGRMKDRKEKRKFDEELVVCKESPSTSRSGCSLPASGSSASNSPAKTSLAPSPVPSTASRKRSYTVIATNPGSGDPNNLSLQKQRHPFSQAQLLALPPREKIPRPPNAFMLFANEWRKKLAIQFPRESNKDISVRLGTMWKNMQKNDKERYFTLARQVDAEHKRKYPNYVYNPKEARMRKALREQSRESRNQVGRSTPAMTLVQANGNRAQPQQGPQQWFKGHPQNFAAPNAMVNRTGRHGLMSPKLTDQQRSMEEMRKSIREQVEQGLMHSYTEMMDMDGLPYHQLTGQMSMPGAGDYSAMAELEGQAWYPFSQGPAHPGSAYGMRHTDEKMHPGAPWNIHFSPEGRAHQASQYMMRHQIIGSTSGYNVNMGQPLLPPAAMNQPTRGAPTPQHQQQQQQHHQQQQQQQQHQQQPPPSYGGIYPSHSSNGNQHTPTVNDKRGQNREERLRMMDLLPTTSSNQATVTSTSQKSSMPSNSFMTTSTTQQSTKMTESNGTKTEKSESAAAITSTETDPDTTATGSSSTENSNRPLPAFEQAFGSTEIGRYSHEGFFNNAQQTPPNQGTQTPDPKSAPAQSSKSSEPVPHPSLLTPICEDFQLEMPSFDLSPVDNLDTNDPLMSSPSWPSMFYYSPASNNGDYFLTPGADNNCFNSSHLSPMPFSSYFDYSLLSNTEFMTEGADEIQLDMSGVPGPSFGGGSNLHVAFDGGGSTILAPGNTFRDTHDGLEYVTLHIPASTLVNSNNTVPQPFHSPFQHNETTNNENETVRNQGRMDKPIRENSFLVKNKNQEIIRSNDPNRQVSKSEFGNSKEEGDLQKQANIKKEPCNENKEDDLQRQELTITGMAMREPIVISQNERICVLMNTPTPITNGKEFTSL